LEFDAEDLNNCRRSRCFCRKTLTSLASKTGCEHGQEDTTWRSEFMERTGQDGPTIQSCNALEWDGWGLISVFSLHKLLATWVNVSLKIPFANEQRSGQWQLSRWNRSRSDDHKYFDLLKRFAVVNTGSTVVTRGAIRWGGGIWCISPQRNSIHCIAILTFAETFKKNRCNLVFSSFRKVLFEFFFAVVVNYLLKQWFPTFLDAFLPLRIFEFFIPPLWSCHSSPVRVRRLVVNTFGTMVRIDYKNLVNKSGPKTICCQITSLKFVNKKRVIVQ